MKSTKKSFLLSTISLVLCFAMLLGTTYAWFTDEVSSGTNRIVAGNLAIDLLMDKGDGEGYVSIAGGKGDIFKEATNANDSTVTLWEPGKTQFAKLAIVNKGNLAVKYTAYIDVTDNGLANALECAFVSSRSGPINTSGYDNWEAVKTAVGSSPVAPGRHVINNGVLDEIANGTPNETEYVLLAVHMKEEAGNEYQGKEALIDVTIVATQKAAEEDAFGSDYDATASGKVPAPMHMKASSKAIVMTGPENDTTTKIDGQDVTGDESVEIKSGSTVATAIVPVSAAQAVMDAFLPSEGVDTSQNREMVLNLNVDTTETKQTSVTYEIGVTADLTYTDTNGKVQQSTSEVHTLTSYLTATINIGMGKENVKVTHNSNPMTAMDYATQTEGIGEQGGYYYDSDTGILTIKSMKFSPFTVSFDLPSMPQFTVTGIYPGLQDIWGVNLTEQGGLELGEMVKMGQAFVANGISFSTAGELPEEWKDATADFVISFDKDIEAIHIDYGAASGYVLPIVPVGKFAGDATEFWTGLGGKWLPAPLSGKADGDDGITFADQTLQSDSFTYIKGTKIRLLDDVLNKGVNCRELFYAIKEFSCGVVFLDDSVGTVNVTVDLVLSPNGQDYYTISSQTFTIDSSNVIPLGIN